MPTEPLTFFFALSGGIFPALLWLFFWLHEDSARPEPRGLITLLFASGMLVVLIALQLERLAASLIPAGLGLVVAWAAIEELLKFGAAYVVALKSRFFDEPIDAVVYLIVVALGFAALENSLFLMSALGKSGLSDGLANQELRFIGASLLHVIASASIGIAAALSFYRGWFLRRTALLSGIAASVALHTLFNFFIMRNNGEDLFVVFGFVWVVAVMFILIFEKIKRMGTYDYAAQ